MENNAVKIVQKMYNNDAYSKWLGIRFEQIEHGFVKLSMTVTSDMTNGFGIAHGGISYALADSALAFASNSEGLQAVSIETSISHVSKVSEGNQLFAEARKLSRSRKIGVYEVKISNQDHEDVAFFKGTVYISSKAWDI